MEPEALAETLRDPPYRQALGVLQMISKSPEDRQYYEDRLKFLREERGKLLAAKQEGEELGLAKGREEGREEGKPAVIAAIHMLQELLQDSPSPATELTAQSLDALTTLAFSLQKRLRDRQV